MARRPQYDFVFMEVMLRGCLGAFRLGFLRIGAGEVGGGGPVGWSCPVLMGDRISGAGGGLGDRSALGTG